MIDKQFYYIETKDHCLNMHLYPGHGNPTPIIWNNSGLYGIICKEKVENILLQLKDSKNLPVLNPNTSIGNLFWDEVEILDPKIAKLLLGG